MGPESEEKKEMLIIDGNAFYEIDLECVKKKKQCALKRTNAPQGNALFVINNEIAHYSAVKKKINDALALYRNSGVQTNMEWHHQEEKDSDKMSNPEIKRGRCLPLYTSEHILISTVHDVFSSPSKKKGECFPIDLGIRYRG